MQTEITAPVAAVCDRSSSGGGNWAALSAVCLGALAVVLDTTIVDVALPSIRQSLGFTDTTLIWVVNAYTLTFGGLLVLGGPGTSTATGECFSLVSCCLPARLVPVESLAQKAHLWRHAPYRERAELSLCRWLCRSLRVYFAMNRNEHGRCLYTASFRLRVVH